MRSVVRFLQSPASLSLAVMTCTAALVGCSQTMDPRSIAPSIVEGVQKQAQITLASVDCPTEARPLKANDTFECVGNIQGGGTAVIHVTQTDETGNVTWKLGKISGLLDLGKVEESIVTGLKSQADVDARVTCGGKWKSAKQGDAFECEATAPDGTAVPIVVTVADNDGNIEWKTK